MKPIAFLLLSFFAGAVNAAPEAPRAVADKVLLAWRDSDATTLDQLAHPELKKRLRTSRLLEFRREQNPKSELSALSDEKIVELFCDAHGEVAPRDNRVDYFDDFVSWEIRGDYAVVRYDSGWRSKTSAQTHRMQHDIILKKSDDRWLFLWSSAVSLHVALGWDAHEELPNQPPQRNAGSRPSSGDSPGSETPSSLGPRG